MSFDDLELKRANTSKIEPHSSQKYSENDLSPIPLALKRQMSLEKCSLGIK
jgi:hypothetical protein